jgi:hypothetical protein
MGGPGTTIGRGAAALSPGRSPDGAGDGGGGAADSGTPRPLAIIEDTGSPFRTAIGHQALIANTTGINNTAAGYQALTANTTGTFNTAVGHRALTSSVTAGSNTALGASALATNTSGISNTAIGTAALELNTTGDANVAVGQRALRGLASGNRNMAVGYSAGISATGSYNIFVGADVSGTPSDSNVIRIGLPYNATTQAGQNATYIAGIRGTAVTGGEGVYVDANGQLGSGPVVPAANSVGAAQVIDASLTAADLATNSVSTAELVDNSVTAAKVAFNYAGSASEGGAAADLACAGCVAASDVGFAYAGLGANTFTGTQRIGAGDLELGPSTATAGNLIKGGVTFLSNPGFMNTFLGEAAGALTATGGTNTAVGGDALRSLAGGDANTAGGYGALYSNVGGTSNTASGMQALFFTTGSANTAVGANAGAANTTGSHNIYVGAEVGGTSGDANTMRLGLPFNATTGAGQSKTFVAGIAGTVLTTPAVPVFVDANGQLGTLTPPPIVGTVNGGVTTGAAPRVDALEQQLDEQRRLNAALQARLARLEAQVANLVRRR